MAEFGTVSIDTIKNVTVAQIQSVNVLDAQQIDKIGKLKELGYDEKQASAVVQRLLKRIRTRPEDDSVLSAMTKLLS